MSSNCVASSSATTADDARLDADVGRREIEVGASDGVSESTRCFFEGCCSGMPGQLYAGIPQFYACTPSSCKAGTHRTPFRRQGTQVLLAGTSSGHTHFLRESENETFSLAVRRKDEDASLRHKVQDARYERFPSETPICTHSVSVNCKMAMCAAEYPIHKYTSRPTRSPAAACGAAATTFVTQVPPPAGHFPAGDSEHGKDLTF